MRILEFRVADRLARGGEDPVTDDFETGRDDLVAGDHLLAIVGLQNRCRSESQGGAGRTGGQ